MNNQEVQRFKELWKVKLLNDLLKVEDLDGTVARSEKNSLERDIRMIRYGYEAGLKKVKRRK